MLVLREGEREREELCIVRFREWKLLIRFSWCCNKLICLLKKAKGDGVEDRKHNSFMRCILLLLFLSFVACSSVLRECASEAEATALFDKAVSEGSALDVDIVSMVRIM